MLLFLMYISRNRIPKVSMCLTFQYIDEHFYKVVVPFYTHWQCVRIPFPPHYANTWSY